MIQLFLYIHAVRLVNFPDVREVTKSCNPGDQSFETDFSSFDKL